MNNREVIIQGEGILNLIPQRPPIVMVDSFFGIEENHSYSGLTVTTDNIFCETGEQQEGEQPETGKLQEAGIIEHIAQSAAARIGFLYTRQGEKVPLGFIGSVDKLKIYDLPKNGMKLFTEITVVQEVFDITLISAQVKVEDKLIAECRMKIFIKKE
ncbi:hydroxymyristoyl-ACP dehydratase [Bacteroides sp.]|uniref:hydroxymyristoyl-ACP dehydratase n=1 Tax=Bacteroides sp. TaxID=29523 RepID=UPI0011DD7DDD|nr:hydroxymyristoyl-ACP dehydratase [Bacteroides sp.]